MAASARRVADFLALMNHPRLRAIWDPGAAAGLAGERANALFHAYDDEPGMQKFELLVSYVGTHARRFHTLQVLG